MTIKSNESSKSPTLRQPKEGWLRRWHDTEWRSPRETERTERGLRALLKDSKPGAWPKRSSILPFLPLSVLPAQRRHSWFYLTGRSISVDNIITTFRRSKELSGTTIGPRVTNDAKSLRSSPGARSRENTMAESNKIFLGRRMRGDDTFVECRNKSAYRVSAWFAE